MILKINIAIDTHLALFNNEIASITSALLSESGTINSNTGVLLFKVEPDTYHQIVGELTIIGYLSKKVITVVTDSGDYIVSWYYYKD